MIDVYVYVYVYVYIYIYIRALLAIFSIFEYI